MLLTALEIQGFKSFPDKTKVTIGKGITAVVGPNGSGKSNISDAIRWVMGETSVKQLRGGGKMENVIFGGTQKRGAMGYAMVNLHIDNTDGKLDVESNNVVIGRKYYRSGESEYSINGQNVRLKDVYELLLDTGLGRDGYAVIGQGKIAEIVGAKSSERREIFEEASGISKFRYRKNEAERRLNSTEENLVRLRDILSELERQVGPLEKECEKAKVFLELSDRKKGLEVTLWVDTANKAKETLREHTRKMEIAQIDYQNVEKNVAECENEAAELHTEQEKYIMQANRLQEEISAVNEEVASADTKIAVLKNNIEHNNESIENLQKEIEERSKGKQDTENEIAKHEAEIEKCKLDIELFNDKAQKFSEQLDVLMAENAKSGQKRSYLTEKLAELTTFITNLKVSIASSKSSVDAAEARLLTVKTECEKAQENCAQLKKEKDDTAEFLKLTLENITKLDNMKQGLSMKLQSKKAVFEKCSETENILYKEIDAAAQRISVLKDLERSMEGYQGSVKKVMNAAGDRRLKGVLGPVASILTVKQGYEVAIETALGFAMQNIIVQDETAAKAAMAMLKREQAGRATFLPLDTVRPSYFDKKLPDNAARASEFVNFNEKYSNIVSNLLGRIVIVEDINDASIVARSLDYKNRIVTKDGQVINAGGSFTGGSVSRTSGMFSRKKEIDELSQRKIELLTKLDEAQKQTDEAKRTADELSAEVVAIDSELIMLNGDKIRCETEFSRIETAFVQAQSVLETLGSENTALNDQIESETKRAQDDEKTLCEHMAESEALEREVIAISGEDDTFLETRTRLSEEISSARLQALGAQKDVENHENAVASLKNLTDGDTERNAQLNASIENLKMKNGEYASNITEIEKNAIGSKEKIAQIRTKIDECTTLRLEKEGQERAKNQEAKQLLQDREDISREIARLSEQKNSKDAEYEQTLVKLWDEYELTIAQAEAMCIEFENVTALRADVAEVRAKIRALGNVNVGAIEEYALVSERYEFMREQINDVEQSKKELIDLITQLSDEMRTIFTESFAQINANFARIFTELFGGGSAKLSLEDDMDVLESGITIEVAPPGKIIKNLSALSGGEQALVAISIYFAILAVNPAPFCILDEIEAALDDVNVTRYARFLRRISDNTQFIVITHRRGTMEEADVLYGVTMQEDGVSKLLKLEVENVDASLIS